MKQIGSTKRTVNEIITAVGNTFVEPQPGRALSRYQLQERIGSGKFGDVWRARDTSANIDLAVKIFRPDRFESTDRVAAAERFHDGVAAMKRLQKHPGIIQVRDGPNVDDGYVWFAMDLYEHRDLAHWGVTRSLSLESKVVLIEQVLDALNYAHHSNIRHRDVRPQNILIEETPSGPRAVLADFDIAYYEDDLRSRDQTTKLIGVLRYVPPDVIGASDEHLTDALRWPSNDLYALGVVLLDLLCERQVKISRKPDRILALLPKSDRHHPHAPSEIVRRGLAGFLAQALASDVVDRFRNADDFARSLNLAIRQSPSARAVVVVSALLTGLLIALGLDWLLSSYGSSGWIRLIGQASAVCAVAGPAILSALGMSARIPPTWVSSITSIATRRPGAARSVAVVSGLACLWTVHATDFWHRFNSVRVIGGGGCAAVTEGDRLVRWFRSGAETKVRSGDVSKLICPRGNPTPETTGMSLLTPALMVEHVERARLELPRLKAVNATTATFEVGTEKLDVRLAWTSPFGVQPPRAEGLLSDEATNWIGRSTQIAFPVISNEPVAELWQGDVNLGLRLIASGLLRTAEGTTAPAEYARAQSDSETQEAGCWADVRANELRQKKLANCPERCCHGKLCEELSTCEERSACKLCRAPNAPWRVRFDGVRIEHAAEWADTKVCLTAGARCKQQCVLARDATVALGMYDCHFTPNELRQTTVVVIGNAKSGALQRIAQLQARIELNPKSICGGITFGAMESRNGTAFGLKLGLVSNDQTQEAQ